MQPFDPRFLERLVEELRQSMRKLLSDLCRDFARGYEKEADLLELPIDWFHTLARTLPLSDFSNWKVAGWIETLNDLLYFVDVLVQVRGERSKRDIVAQLHAEFQEKFYENSYNEEVFPLGKPEPRLILQRLTGLCRRLAAEVTQESVWLAPEQACRWARSQRAVSWCIPCDFAANMERVEPPGTLSLGSGKMVFVLPGPTLGPLKRAGMRAQLLVGPSRIDMALGSRTYPVVEFGTQPRWHCEPQDPKVLRRTEYGDLLLGPTLVYDRFKVPTAVEQTPPAIRTKIRRALHAIEASWPEGNRWLSLLTSRVSPLKARGVVSFSYRHRPGLSVINCYDRDNLDLIDDLIHENSHHHLNLLLRKYVMYEMDRNQEIFYSPWRRSLRPIRGILHATFTFTMGALLFERLSAWAESSQGNKSWKKAGLTRRDLWRARARCFEEIESVRYAMQDLQYAGGHLRWLTVSGRQLVGHLETAIDEAERRIAPYRNAVLGSAFGPELRKHSQQLKQARRTYGPMRLSKA
ncbi:MAG TPA: HEXXH motif-containing putative peptide modification protein [Nitrospiraceae bacterium]|nr:HEXXH motif-containing putative peptide modification protein [Nitrospiraceae bacterium]